jgi:MFS family permease
MSLSNAVSAEARKNDGAERARVTLVAAILPAAFLIHVDRQAMVVRAPMIQKEFHLALPTIIQVLSVAIVSNEVCQISSARLVPRLGPALTIGIGVIGWSIAVASIAFTTDAWCLLFSEGRWVRYKRQTGCLV